jgi:hypothetical protein
MLLIKEKLKLSPIETFLEERQIKISLLNHILHLVNVKEKCRVGESNGL